MAVNYLGAAQFSRAVISGMKGRREGSIVFVSSQGGLCGIYGFAAYAASKFALRGLAEALAMEVIALSSAEHFHSLNNNQNPCLYKFS